MYINHLLFTSYISTGPILPIALLIKISRKIPIFQMILYWYNSGMYSAVISYSILAKWTVHFNPIVLKINWKETSTFAYHLIIWLNRSISCQVLISCGKWNEVLVDISLVQLSDVITRAGSAETYDFNGELCSWQGSHSAYNWSQLLYAPADQNAHSMQITGMLSLYLECLPFNVRFIWF